MAGGIIEFKKIQIGRDSNPDPIARNKNNASVSMRFWHIESMWSVLSVTLRGTIRKVIGKNIRRQLLRGSLLGLILAPTILIWLVLASFFFGYYPVASQGNSMEPVLRNGDAIWVKQLDIAKVNVGDIVTLHYPSEGPITHRVVGVELMPQGSYLVVTKGDANRFAEAWEISADERVPVSVARVRFAGYALDFLDTLFGRVLFIAVPVVALIAMWIRRKRIKLRVNQPASSRFD